MSVTTYESYLVCHLNHIAPVLERQKTCINSLKLLRIALRMVTKGSTLVNTRNLTNNSNSCKHQKQKRH